MHKAIVTGASSGIGRAVAIELGKAGYALALIGRDRERLEETLYELPPESRAQSRVVVADLAGDVTGLITRVQTGWSLQGPLDAIVHCAGVAVSGRAQDIPPEEFERIWRVNFVAPALLTREALPQLLAKDHGTLVFVTSGVGSRALPYVAPYCSAKAALDAFSESLRVELSSTGLHVLLFSPGAVATGFHRAMRHFGGTKLDFPPVREQTAQRVAIRLVRAMRHREPRVTLGVRAKIGRRLNALYPRLTDRIVSTLYRIS